MDVPSFATWTTTVINSYLIVALVFCDLWTRHVLGFESSMLLRESLRFFGITSLLIVLVHAQVAAGYPRPMMVRAFLVQAVYYTGFAAFLFYMLPAANVAAQLHMMALLLAAAMFGALSFSAPVPRERAVRAEPGDEADKKRKKQ